MAVWLSSKEEGTSITEYLKMLKDASPHWAPRFAMCDNCGAEFNGFLCVFPANSSELKRVIPQLIIFLSLMVFRGHPSSIQFTMYEVFLSSDTTDNIFYIALINNICMIK